MTRYPFEIPDLAGRALTVAGPVDPAVLGQTLMHEHIFVDLRRPPHARRPDEDGPEAAQPLTIENLARVRHGASNADNDVLDDFDEMLEEVTAFRERGGSTIVDVSSMSRAPEKLRRISAASGLHVVMGAGYYTPTFHPVDMDDRTVDDLTDGIVRDIVVGVDGTGVRSGIIGEVGVGDVGAGPGGLSENERKSVRASGRASRRTGAPITFHIGGQGEDKFTVMDILADEGVAPDNIVFGHANNLATDLDYGRRVLDRGVFIEIDFLCPPGSPWGALFLPGDQRALPGLVTLLGEGYAGQILLGHDVCQKIQLTRYGGKGFTYISDHYLPALRRRGVDDATIERLMVANPARALAFAAPGAE